MLNGGVAVVQVLANVAVVTCEWRMGVEVLLAFIGVVCKLVLLGLNLLRGHSTRDERGMWWRAVGGQRLERLRNTHHELVGDVTEALDFALKLGDFALERIVLLLDVKDVRTG